MTCKLNRLEQTQTTTPKHLGTFYPKVLNNTKIQFTSEEMSLLNKGLKYNLNHKNKNWIQTLAFKTETAIAQLPSHEQDDIRFRAAHNIKQLHRQQPHNKQQNPNHDTKERHTLRQIQNKLTANKAAIFKADKGNSIVVMYLADYNIKVQDFINDSNFITLNKDPTKVYQKRIKDTIKNCPSTLSKENNRTTLTNMNPKAPNIRGLPKVHKPGCPIGP